MIIQIGGIVILTTSIICLTWWTVANKRLEAQRAEDARRQRQSRNKAVFENEALMLYEDEKQRRIAAETRERIAKDQLRRAREQMAKIHIKEVK